MLLKALVGSTMALLTAGVAQPQTLDEIVARSLAASGGAERLKAVRTRRMTGTMKVMAGEGSETPIVIESMRPRSMRFELKVRGVAVIQAFDGRKGWKIVPFAGDTTPYPMPKDEQSEAAERAEFDSPLLDAAARGTKIRLQGRDEVDGSEAFKLRVTRKDGFVRDVWVDSRSFLEVRHGTKRSIEGRTLELHSTFSDFREVSGLKLPFRVVSSTKGRPEAQVVVFDSIELDVPIDESRFSMPKGGAPAMRD
jgi:hypothetical protein